MRRAAIERLLPAAYQRAAGPGSVLGALLDVMEALHAPDEAVLADVDALFGPYRTPDGFVAYLTRWVAMDHVVAAPRADAPLPLPVGRLRDLVAHGALLARWRGTPYGMRTALELATGVTGFVLDEPAERPFHLVVRVPPAAADRLALVTRIVEAEKPAAVTVEVVAGDPADPPSDPPADPTPPGTGPPTAGPPDPGPPHTPAPPEPDDAEPAAGVATVRAVGRAHVPAPLPHDPPEEPS
ncbi:phage tail protein [Micromonospora tulbaghiae]|uniref:Phage tail protein domain-containing protein n=1 Tax=Micromonospora tulbaghiae TaxID=479978 RepID=A0ABY0KIG6_9ACTN|nr:phage tail protein [Micromonospora tulbaghiae]MDX5460398.1 phage tail protein [Micromonospora tulbaghiae]SCE76753.1 phage tail protein domain-containing protein [Micromonospora tulbaghiae]